MSSAANRRRRRPGSPKRIKKPSWAGALRAALGLLACALAALVYQNSFDNPFVFDDRETVLLNPALIAPWDWSAAAIQNIARPIVTLSYAFDRGFWGFSSFGFHVTNVVLHIVVVGLFYGWCTRVVGSDPARTGVKGRADRGQTGGRRGSDTSLTPDWAAFFAAAIFALHPVMSAAVGYVSARSELLAAAGFLASLTFARRAIVARSRTAAILAGIFGALAIGSSSSAAALPIVVLAYDAWVLRDPRWPVRLARVYAPATLAIVSIAAWHVSGAGINAVPDRGPVANLLMESRVLWRYVMLLVVPRGQSLVHDVHWVTSVFDPVSLAALAASAAAVAAAIWNRKRYPLVAFGIIWFIGGLAATTSFLPVRDAMAEHRLYLASPGLLLAAASVTWRPVSGRRALRIVLTAVLALLATQTYRRNQLWSNPMEVWEQSVRRAPNAWQSHWGYGELLREIGQCDRARSEYASVLRLYPDHAGGRAGLDACR